MFSLWRPLGLHATTTICSRVARVTHSKDDSASLWAFRKKSNFHITIPRRYSSHLEKQVRHEGFRTHSGIYIKSGDTVELEDRTFLRVVHVLHNEYHNRYWVSGRRFVHNKDTCGLPRHDSVDPNEVYWVVHSAKNDPRPAEEQALIEVEGSQILRKRTMTMVNTTYPAYQKWTGADLGVPGPGALFCRWKHVVITKTRKLQKPLDAFHITAAEIAEASFQQLRFVECDDGHNSRISDETLRRSWRGITRRGGASTESKEPESAAFTFADVCCGAGRASRGAEMAGFKLRWALDHNAAACETFHLNFPEARLYQKQLTDVAHMWRGGLKVDILHLSPPCQAFSPAKTTANLENDRKNIAANMEIGSCLGIARPRIVTLEQTSGLMSRGRVGGKHHEHWRNVIEQFTSRGYSVAWKIMNLAELGLPQPRKRLIMIASW